MQIELDVVGEGNHRRLVMSHDDAKLEWNIGFANGLKYLQPVVREVNGYWAKMSITRQLKIFQQYEVIHGVLENVSNETRLLPRLRKEMEVLFEMHPYLEAEEYVRRYGKVKYPRDLRTEYGIDAPATALTYLRSDYQSLLVLTLLMRVALPVLGAYIFRIKESSGTIYKEMKAMTIMSMTHVVECTPYKKLYDYISTYTEQSVTTLAAIINGLGTESRVDWLLAQTLVRRIAISELVHDDESGDAQNLVRSIYNFIRNLIDSPDKRHGGPIRDKIPDIRDGEDNMGRAEQIKVKQPVSEGNLVAYSVYAEEYRRMAHRIDPTIDLTLVDAAIIKLRADNSFSATNNQITLIQFVINCVIPARGILQLEYDALVCAAGVAQALLWHWGFKDLAAIVTAKKNKLPTSTMLGVMRLKLTKDQVAALIRLYPHFMYVAGKGPRPTFDGTTSKETMEQLNMVNNVAIKAIDSLSSDLANAAWDLRLPEEYQNGLTLVEGEYGYVVSAAIRNQLADLVIKTATLK